MDLAALGIRPAAGVHQNLPVASLVQAALARGEGTLAGNGALVTKTFERTGRSPKDKYIVRDPETEERVWWGPNQPTTPQTFQSLWERASAYVSERDIFVTDAWACADPAQRVKIRVVAELAWHALFARQLFRRPPRDSLAHFNPEWAVLSVPNFRTEPATDGTNSDAFVAIEFSSRRILVLGTHYAGEIKKSIFTVLNYLMPQRAVLSMHCSANVGGGGDVALFFGLSGTGKTTLSADPARRLIGDDEHGWSDDGVFNFEGGCYAKCIRLSAEKEPQIWNAIRFGSVVENVVVDPHTREIDYDDDSITENTRAAYPLEFIPGAVPEARAGHAKTVIFLTADAFGVLPPVSKLTLEQASYHFISGFTSKLAGTEAGIGTEPEATFSTCFGAPFLPRHPTIYADMLTEKLAEHGARAYLVNTGWSGGPFGIGRRIDLGVTRKIVSAAMSGELEKGDVRQDPLFGLQVPSSLDGVSSKVLWPRDTWEDPSAYDAKAKELASKFAENFSKFEGKVSSEVLAAGPRI